MPLELHFAAFFICGAKNMFDDLFMHGDGQSKFNELIQNLGKIQYCMNKSYGIYVEIISGHKYYPTFQYDLSTERYAILYESYTSQKLRFNLKPHLEVQACFLLHEYCKELRIHTTERYCDVIPRMAYQIFESLSQRN